MVKDVSETDRFGRLLRYVYLGDTFINAELVRLGCAEATEYRPDNAQAGFLEGLETQARASLIGCHGLGMFGSASPAPTATRPANTATRPRATPAPPPAATAVFVPTQAPLPTEPPPPTIAPAPPGNCDRNSYPDVCIPHFPPDLDCGQIGHRRFTVRQPDPHGFDGDNDGVGCESG
jgi:micrococcal nuclease